MFWFRASVAQICYRCRSLRICLNVSVCLWFALMLITRVWGDSLVLSPCVSLPAVGFLGVKSTYKSLCTSATVLLWCCHQTKVAHALNEWISAVTTRQVTENVWTKMSTILQILYQAKMLVLVLIAFCQMRWFTAFLCLISSWIN